ncbi:MAG: 30S ribosome-binding factor RbfA [Acidithiobacillus sp.]
MVQNSHRGYPRRARVAQLLQEEIAALLPEMHALSSVIRPLPPTISLVELAPDMHSAIVYFSLMTGPERAEAVRAALQESAGQLRQALGKRLALRRIPPLRFVYDARFDRGAEMAALLAGLPRPGGEGEE